MKLKRLAVLGASIVLSLSSLVVFAPLAHASTITWDGEGGDNNFSTAANWTGDVVPGASDDVIFDNTVELGDQTYHNDLIGAAFQSITFQGDGSNHYTIDGNEFSLTIGIGNNSSAQHIISADIALSGVVIIYTVNTNEPGSDLHLEGKISGTGTLKKQGDGEAYVSGEITYAGDLQVSEGALGMRAYADDLPFASIQLDDNTTLALNAFDFSGVLGTESIYTLSKPVTSGAANLDLTTFGTGGDLEFHMTGNLTLTGNMKVFGYDNVVTRVQGAISGNGFTITPGDTTMTIFNESNANSSATPDGDVNESQVTYEQNSPLKTLTVPKKNTAIVTGTYGAAIVNAQGMLKGTGTVGVLTVQSGGILAPGNSPGCINSGNLVLNGTFQVEIGGTTACSEYDQTKVTGSVDVTGGTLEVSLFDDFKPEANQTYTIIDNDTNADAVTGTFTNLAEGATFESDGYVYRVSYVGGDGNDVTLTVVSVPETPNTGLRLIGSHPLLTFIVTSGLAGLIALIARCYNKTLARQ